MKSILFTLLVGFLLMPNTAICQKIVDTNEGTVFTDIKEAFKKRDRVYHLDLSHQKLTQIPEKVIFFENLKTLNLSHNQLTNLDGFDFSQLSHLEGVNLYQNELMTIPSRLSDCKNLQELNIGSNQVKEIPAEITNIKFLAILKLHHNQIQRIPSDWSFDHLKFLRLDNNQLTELPEDLFANNPNIIYLNVNNNQIQKLPSSIYNSRIEELNIGANEIKEWGSLGTLYRLRILVIDWNKVQEEDLEIIASIRNLRTLSMESCGITALPVSMGNLRKLKELSLINNSIVELPSYISNMRKLRKIWLYNNNLTSQQIQELQYIMPKLEIIKTAS